MGWIGYRYAIEDLKEIKFVNQNCVIVQEGVITVMILCRLGEGQRALDARVSVTD